jgi:hypothetical protein
LGSRAGGFALDILSDWQCPKRASHVPGRPFHAIEKLKHAVASLDGLAAVSGAESKILERMGTASSLSAGDFLTAAHVFRELQKGERACPTAAITLPAHEWRPEAHTEEMR